MTEHKLFPLLAGLSSFSDLTIHIYFPVHSKLRAEEERRQREAALASKLVTLQEKEEPVEPGDLGEAAASENEGKDETATEDLPAAEVRNFVHVTASLL